VYLKGNGAALKSFNTSKIRRDPGANNNTAVAVLFDSASQASFDSSNTGNWSGGYLCNVAASTPAWAHFRADGSDPVNSGTWSTPGSYVAYNGTNFGAQTFPDDPQPNITVGGKCPPSWTSLYTLVFSAENGARCQNGSCHAGAQVNKWNLTTQQTAYDDGVAKNHWCTTCTPTATRAACSVNAITRKVVAKTTRSSVYNDSSLSHYGLIGWDVAYASSGCLGDMPKSGCTAPDANNPTDPGDGCNKPWLVKSEVEDFLKWQEAGAKND
jgi:hypothetical protein